MIDSSRSLPPSRTFRSGIVSAKIKTAEITTATYAGQSYLVVPVVALVGDSVILPHGASGPEFVPKEVLSYNPQTWAGRPIIFTHPLNATPDGSANYPEYLESNQYGVVFGAQFNGSSIIVQAYIDPVRAKDVGAESVIEDLSSGKVVEISVGAWVTAVEENGTSPSGEEYEWRWTSVSSDHLAVGLNGAKGACSVDNHGCGAGRAAIEKGKGDTTVEDEKTENGNVKSTPGTPATPATNTPPPPARTPSLLSRLLSLIRSNEADTSGTSDAELHKRVARVLRDEVVGFDWLSDIYQDTNTIIYYTYNNGSHTFQRTYTVGPAGEISLNDDAEEVEVAQVYKPIAAVSAAEKSEDMPDASDMPMKKKKKKMPMEPEPMEANVSQTDGQGQPCGCKKGKAMKKATQAQLKAASDEEEEVETEETETEEEAVEAKPVAAKSKGKAATSTSTSTPQSTSPSTPKTLQQWMADAPPEFQAIVHRHLAQEAAHRDGLIAGLVAAQQVFSKEDLTAKPTDELEKLYTLSAPKDTDTFSTPSPSPATFDYSGIRVFSHGPATATRDFNPPDPWKVGGATTDAKN